MIGLRHTLITAAVEHTHHNGNDKQVAHPKTNMQKNDDRLLHLYCGRRYCLKPQITQIQLWDSSSRDCGFDSAQPPGAYNKHRY